MMNTSSYCNPAVVTANKCCYHSNNSVLRLPSNPLCNSVTGHTHRHCRCSPTVYRDTLRQRKRGSTLSSVQSNVVQQRHKPVPESAMSSLSSSSTLSVLRDVSSATHTNSTAYHSRINIITNKTIINCHHNKPHNE